MNFVNRFRGISIPKPIRWLLWELMWETDFCNMWVFVLQVFRKGNSMVFDVKDLDEAVDRVKTKKVADKDDVQGEFLKNLSLNDKLLC